MKSYKNMREITNSTRWDTEEAEHKKQEFNSAVGSTVKDHILKKCPWFYEFEEIFHKHPTTYLSDSMGHAMAETPAGVARTLWYIVRTSHLLSVSINQPFLSYLSSGYEPGSQGIFIEETLSLYCILAFVDLTCHLQVCRPPPVARGTTKCNVALLRIPRSINQQPATKCFGSVTFLLFRQQPRRV